jgi:hypothetical protein
MIWGVVPFGSFGKGQFPNASRRNLVLFTGFPFNANRVRVSTTTVTYWVKYTDPNTVISIPCIAMPVFRIAHFPPDQ